MATPKRPVKKAVASKKVAVKKAPVKKAPIKPVARKPVPAKKAPARKPAARPAGFGISGVMDLLKLFESRMIDKIEESVRTAVSNALTSIHITDQLFRQVEAIRTRMDDGLYQQLMAADPADLATKGISDVPAAALQAMLKLYETETGGPDPVIPTPSDTPEPAVEQAAPVTVDEDDEL